MGTDRPAVGRTGRMYGRHRYTTIVDPTEEDPLLFGGRAAPYVRSGGWSGKRRTIMKGFSVVAIVGLLALVGLKTNSVNKDDAAEDTTAVLQAAGTKANYVAQLEDAEYTTAVPQADDAKADYLAQLESKGQDRIAGLVEGVGSLDLVATNEYGEYDRLSQAFYRMEMILEPHKPTMITALADFPANKTTDPSTEFYWYMHQADDFRDLRTDLPAEVSELLPTRYTAVSMTEAGSNYWLWVAAVKGDYDETNTVEIVADGLIYVSCKYVRREVRDLNDEDSVKYFQAMRTFHTVSLEEGRTHFGSTFANAKIMAAYHASQKFCLYGGLNYFIAHAAMNLWVERSLQIIDPSVSLAYWDFTRDTGELGANWTASKIFSPEMFGSALGNPADEYGLGEGWFHGLSSLYDPREKFVHEKIDPSHNPYGFIDSEFSFAGSGNVTRTASYCEMESELELSNCNVIQSCFEDNDKSDAWSTCMQNAVLEGAYGMLGGAYDCAVSMNTYRAEHPEYSRGLLSFAVGYVVSKVWPTNVLSDFNECDTDCTSGSKNETCGCTCTTNFLEWSDDKVFEFALPGMEAMSEWPHGDEYVFIESIAGETKAGFMQDGVHLDTNTTAALLRQLLVVACEPGSLGAMAGAAAPMDPIYYPLHATFEKTMHILALSPTYEYYDFSWVEHDCGDGVSGAAIDDKLPFTERYLGVGDSSEFLNNGDLWTILDPRKPSLPAVYDKIQTWGKCREWHFDV